MILNTTKIFLSLRHSLSTFLVSLLLIYPAFSQTSVDTELSLVIDVSGSVSNLEYQQQRDGYVAAFNNPDVIAGLIGGPQGRSAVNVIQFATSADEAISFTIIDSQQSALNFANMLSSMAELGTVGGSTNPNTGIDLASNLLTTNNIFGQRLVIDLSGDGQGFGSADRQARDNALAAGVDAINAIAIGDSGGSLVTYYENNIIGGEGSFALSVDTFEQFADVLDDKLIRELAQVPSRGVIAISRREETVRITDVSAIMSANNSGIPFALAQREIQFDATRTSIRDLNARLFRLRSRQRAQVQETPPPPVDTYGYSKSGEPEFRAGKQASKKTVVMVQPNQPLPRDVFGIFVGGDFSYTDQDRIGRAIGFDNETWAGTVGAEYRPTEEITLGLGASYLDSNADIGGGLGEVHSEGFSVSPYISYFNDGFYADLLYSLAYFDNDLRRNTLFGKHAEASPNSLNHTIAFHTGYNMEVAGLIMGPLVGAEYMTGELDGYSERGGGNANMDFDSQGYDSLLTKLGWQISAPIPTNFGSIVPQARAAWHHEFLNEGDTVTGRLQKSPFIVRRGDNISRQGGYKVSAESQAAGSDYFSAGGGVSVNIGDAYVVLDYEGHFFRDNNTAHMGSIRVGMDF